MKNMSDKDPKGILIVIGKMAKKPVKPLKQKLIKKSKPKIRKMR